MTANLHSNTRVGSHRDHRPVGLAATRQRVTWGGLWQQGRRLLNWSQLPSSHDPRILEWVGRTWVEPSVWVERTAVCVGDSAEARPVL